MTQLLLLMNEQASGADERRRVEHLRTLSRAARERTSVPVDPISVRMLGDGDRIEVERLAGVDSGPVLSDARLLGAEVDGRLVAAFSLDGGAVVADPFRPSSAAVELLRIRARQLGGTIHRPRRRPRLGLLRRHPARATLAGSPPGSGGRLLQL